MKPRHSLISLFAVALVAVSAFGQQSPELEKVLDQMDKMAASFRTTQADFVSEQYQKVVDETERQKGKVYFRRSGNETQMVADVQTQRPQNEQKGAPSQTSASASDKKYVLFSDSKVQIYQPGIDQITVIAAGKNRAEFESFLVLGFGGSGHDLLKSFDVKYLGREKIGDVDTAKLDLTPKTQKVRNTFAHIVLWIDTARGVSVQQQLFEPSGDYRLAKYSSIELNQKISDGVFKIKTTPKTKTVSPQG